ncbi:Amino acid kinase family protein [Candidatus Methylobacter favarea]|uniref:Amino acid kinase family protein n=1 Tax=Candidatus Methylobacter favarea TaxID=2707345 RepID=A0A8S0XK50_9GAMM|nr:uridylate kinase [Candidatus Methylobacter favarea]CAA9891800.1 Amino acid kinase family protein [Candidatus Methylobacter favarea]
MIIIKLGGSLAETDALYDCLDSVEQKYQGRAVVIVPGGGAFAEQVRAAQKHWRFDDRTAHHMAILAMHQMALLFKGLKPDFSIAGSLLDIREQLSRQRVVIWSPAIVQLDNAGIQANWDITSDSLSAWLAGALSASELILVKSAAIDAKLSLAQLAGQDIIDSAFCDFTAQAAFKITVINARNF